MPADRYRVTVLDFDGLNITTVDDEEHIEGWLWRTLKDRREYARTHGIHFDLRVNYLEKEHQ